MYYSILFGGHRDVKSRSSSFFLSLSPFHLFFFPASFSPERKLERERNVIVSEFVIAKRERAGEIFSRTHVRIGYAQNTESGFSRGVFSRDLSLFLSLAIYKFASELTNVNALRPLTLGERDVTRSLSCARFFFFFPFNTRNRETERMPETSDDRLISPRERRITDIIIIIILYITIVINAFAAADITFYLLVSFSLIFNG